MLSLQNSNSISSTARETKRARRLGFMGFHKKRAPQASASRIRRAEQAAGALSDQKLAKRSSELQEQAAEKIDDAVINEFGGLIAESIFRSVGFRLYDVQVGAMIAGAQGAIVEMHTGEGKTVVTGAIAALKSLGCPSIHVGTTNTYLAARDLESVAPAFDMLGISHGLLPEESDETASRKAYRKQVVYGPGYQYGFDYLQDQMFLRDNRQSELGISTVNQIRGNDPFNNLIQPSKHHVALIDEADSVMIDEAMTPLIISLPAKSHEDPTPYLLAKKITSEFAINEHYHIELPSKKIEVTDAANVIAHDAIAKIKGLSLARPWRTYIVNAIRAQEVYERDIDYVVRDDSVQIVDQNTGRIFSDRTWQSGLHQAVEAKENVPIQPGRESTTQITRQRYLQMYSSLAGLTGTGASVAEEFKSVYGCRVIPIPTNKPNARKILKTRFFSSLQAKLDAIAVEVAQRHKTRQPILIGTRTIRESLDVRDALLARGINPLILNGIQDGEEAEIVSQAGIAGAITIATNMAGRGTDIKPDKEALAVGGLHVIGVSPNDSKRIDRQLVGRAARQGQPGSAHFFAAATDLIFVQNNSSMPKQIKRRAKRSGEAPDFSRELANLQKAIEARNHKLRNDMILRDRWMDSVRESIAKD